MRNLLLAFLLLGVAMPSAAQSHTATPADELIRQFRQALHSGEIELQTVPPPAPDDFNATAAREFAIEARRFEFVVTPSAFVVNEGDSVTLRVRSSDVLHGFFMERYVNGVTLPQGTERVIQFVANQVGSFTFFCTQPACGTGHDEMGGTFTVNAAQTDPTIDSVTPATGPVAGGTAITISGTNFAAGATVTIGEVAATNVVVVNATTITATTPPGSLAITDDATVEVVVTNPDSKSVTKVDGFTYVRAPFSVLTIAPNVGLTIARNPVTIKGTGFTTGLPTSVRFGDTDLTVTVVDATTLTAIAEPHAAGVFDVVVRVGDEQITIANGYTYQTVPPKRRATRK